MVRVSISFDRPGLACCGLRLGVGAVRVCESSSKKTIAEIYSKTWGCSRLKGTRNQSHTPDLTISKFVVVNVFPRSGFPWS